MACIPFSLRLRSSGPSSVRNGSPPQPIMRSAGNGSTTTSPNSSSDHPISFFLVNALPFWRGFSFGKLIRRKWLFAPFEKHSRAKPQFLHPMFHVKHLFLVKNSWMVSHETHFAPKSPNASPLKVVKQRKVSHETYQDEKFGVER